MTNNATVNNQKNYSLQRRLLVSAAVLMVGFFLLMGYGLNRAFKQSVLENANSNLKNQALLILASMDVVDGQITVPDALPEPRLMKLDSDLFAQVSDGDQKVVWRSASLLGQDLVIKQSLAGEFVFDEYYQSPNNAASFAINFAGTWESEQGDLEFQIVVAEHKKSYLKRLKSYQRQVALWLSVLGVLLLILLLSLFSWLLTPLAKVTQQISEVEQGKRQRFDDDYPLEVSRLTNNLNQLLAHDEQRIEQHKQVLGNLAHSLKTPLAVLKGIDFQDKVKVDAMEQLDTMQSIIDYQLHSASTVGRRHFSKPIEVEAITRKIINSLNKIHRDKPLTVELDIQAKAVFFGDQGDWMELLGNLLENAYKWTDSEISVRISNLESSTSRQSIKIQVSDNGPGIDPDAKVAVLKRGMRLDNQTPGHGLGLHIVKGIVDAYQGEIRIEANQPKGTVFEVVLN